MSALAITKNGTNDAANDWQDVEDGFDSIESFINAQNLDNTNINNSDPVAGLMDLASSQAVSGPKTFTGNVAFGVDDTGVDVTMHGATAGKSWLWDESADTMIVTGAATISETLGVTGLLTVGNNIVSDTDSTDDLGTSSVRWANLYVDTIGDVGQTLAIAGSVSFDGGTFYVDHTNDRIGIGTTSPETFQTIAMQGSDDEFFNVRSTDVDLNGLDATAHVLSDATFFQLAKAADNSGGVIISSYQESTANQPFLHRAYAQASGGWNKTKTSAGGAAITFDVYEHDGAGSLEDIEAEANLWSVRRWDQTGMTTHMVWMVNEDGNYYYDGTGNAFDFDPNTGKTHDDVAILSALDLVVSKNSVIQTEWEDFIRYGESDLIEMGVLGAPVSEGGLVCGSILQKVVVGAVRQLGRELGKVKAENIEMKNEIKRLAA